MGLGPTRTPRGSNESLLRRESCESAFPLPLGGTTSGGTAAALYRQRKGTVEPVLGILKEVPGFRPFSRRGLAAATREFTLLALAYNINILARGTPRTTSPPLAPPADGGAARPGLLRLCAALLGRTQRLLSAGPPADANARTLSRRLLLPAP